jgi:hypothetical protein
MAELKDGDNISHTYYSVGGGFVVQEGAEKGNKKQVSLRYDVHDADELLQNCMRAGLSISQLVTENEKAWRPQKETEAGLLKIWSCNARMHLQRLLCRRHIARRLKRSTQSSKNESADAEKQTGKFFHRMDAMGGKKRGYFHRNHELDQLLCFGCKRRKRLLRASGNRPYQWRSRGDTSCVNVLPPVLRWKEG